MSSALGPRISTLPSSSALLACNKKLSILRDFTIANAFFVLGSINFLQNLVLLGRSDPHGY